MAVETHVTEELGSEIHVVFAINAPPVEHKDVADLAPQDEEDESAIPLYEGKSLWTARVKRNEGAEKFQAAMPEEYPHQLCTPRDGNVGQANYAASKSGLFGLTKSLAREAVFQLNRARSGRRRDRRNGKRGDSGLHRHGHDGDDPG